MIFHTAGNKEKKIFIMNNEKKKIDAVGWKSYCSRLYCGAGRCRRWARVAGRTARSRRWASVRVGRARRARQAGVSGHGAQGVLGRAGRACWGAQGGRRTGAGGRGRARGERQLGAGAGARQGARRAASRRWARGRQALGTRGARWALEARAAWAPGLALGSALGALGPFSIRFDSFFFLSHQMNTVHCKIIFFRKKK